MAVRLGNDSNFNEIVSKNNKVVVKYYADWCGGCKLFAPKFVQLSNEEIYNGIAFIDINAETNPYARRLAGVSNLPFFAVFKDGKLIETLASSAEESVSKLIDKLQ